MVVLTQQILEGTNDNGKRTKDEINVPIALSAFRDKRPWAFFGGVYIYFNKAHRQRDR